MAAITSKTTRGGSCPPAQDKTGPWRRRALVVESSQCQTARLKFTVRVATTPAELRGAAYLRALSFYNYPADRSPYAARMHQRMKADAEWSALQQKVGGTDSTYKDVKVTCLIATMADDPEDDVAREVTGLMDLSAKLPSPSTGSPAELVVGTLDLNQGLALPSEELVGRLPEGSEAVRGRAYLANVCVAQPARRQGVAQALMTRAEVFARSEGVQQLYVHVVGSNTAAVDLYVKSLGMEVESEESEGRARQLNRPRRLLLRKTL